LSYESFHEGGCEITSRQRPPIVRPLALAVVTLLAAGCATRASHHRLTNDVLTLRSEVGDIRQAQDLTMREVARTVAETRSFEARLAELAAAEKSAAAEVAALRGRLGTVETELREPKGRGVATTPPPTAPAAARPPAAAAAAPTPAGERPRETVPPALGAEQTYNAALATFRAREYGQAVLDFLDFLSKYPKHSLAANAQYWIGEAYYVQRDYRQSAAEFQKVVDIAPESSKVPDALLKLGLCHFNLRDEPRARQTWDRVAKDYPKSEAAVKARSLLRAKTSTAKG
jgi:tol-pal system protein YbgF